MLNKTKQQLAQNQLPVDKLSIDIYNSIKNMVSENIKNSQLINDIENTTAELVLQKQNDKELARAETLKIAAEQNPGFEVS